MKLFVLRPIVLDKELPPGGQDGDEMNHYAIRDDSERPPDGISPMEWPWIMWYDMVFGLVVRAETEMHARELASTYHSNEGQRAWLDQRFSTCTELTTEGPAEVILYHPEWA